ncbi:MAG: imidazole glycerol phosphate synthase subunit HisH [Longimicrobiales bacterium]|nr:imidazole glycerol phosphate synthase subunit HisH [Longimicrobiales bacterium]
MKLLLFDYGTGNLHSLRKALERQGAEVTVGADPGRADGLVLPGVGAFGAAAERLASYAGAIRGAVADGLPVLGICLGMQLLLDASDEGAGAGLGLVPGRVRKLRAERVPHMGWNTVASDDPLFAGVGGDRFYFANSFVADPVSDADVIAWTRHEGDRFPAAVRRGRVVGTQFHPEKSGASGLRILRNFVALARDAGAPGEG